MYVIISASMAYMLPDELSTYFIFSSFVEICSVHWKDMFWHNVLHRSHLLYDRYRGGGKGRGGEGRDLTISLIDSCFTLFKAQLSQI